MVGQIWAALKLQPWGKITVSLGDGGIKTVYCLVIVSNSILRRYKLSLTSGIMLTEWSFADVTERLLIENRRLELAFTHNPLCFTLTYIKMGKVEPLQL